MFFFQIVVLHGKSKNIGQSYILIAVSSREKSFIGSKISYQFLPFKKIFFPFFFNCSQKERKFTLAAISHKEWLVHSNRTDKDGKYCYNFAIAYKLTLIVGKPTHVPNTSGHHAKLFCRGVVSFGHLREFLYFCHV